MNLAEWNAEHPGSVLRSRAAELAAELTGLRALVENFVRQAEARYLELLRELRREFPAADGDDYFVLFLDRAGLPSANALENLKLWETARSHRAVREAADGNPAGALAFTSRLLRLDPGQRVRLDDDPDVARVMTMPPRQMSAEIRRLLDMRGGLASGAPAGPNEAAGSAAGRGPTSADIRRAVEEAERGLADLARLVGDAPALGAAEANRLLTRADLMHQHIDTVCLALDGFAAPAGEGDA